MPIVPTMERLAYGTLVVWFESEVEAWPSAAIRIPDPPPTFIDLIPTMTKLAMQFQAVYNIPVKHMNWQIFVGQ